jgi:hypothetical protein
MTEKTFKREVAVAMLIWLVYLVETKDIELIEILLWPILAPLFACSAAAFGFDAYGKLQQSLKSASGERT